MPMWESRQYSAAPAIVQFCRTQECAAESGTNKSQCFVPYLGNQKVFSRRVCVLGSVSHKPNQNQHTIHAHDKAGVVCLFLV